MVVCQMLQNGSIVIIKIQYIMVTVIIAVVAIDIIIRGRILVVAFTLFVGDAALSAGDW